MGRKPGRLTACITLTGLVSVYTLASALWLHGQVFVIVGFCGKQDVPAINKSHVTVWDKVAFQGLTSPLLHRLAGLLGQTCRAVLLCIRRV